MSDLKTGLAPTNRGSDVTFCAGTRRDYTCSENIIWIPISLLITFFRLHGVNWALNMWCFRSPWSSICLAGGGALWGFLLYRRDIPDHAINYKVGYYMNKIYNCKYMIILAFIYNEVERKQWYSAHNWVKLLILKLGQFVCFQTRCLKHWSIILFV